MRYPQELRADFQQYYHLNIDRVGVDYEVVHAVELALQLPLGCRTYSAIDPTYSWSNQEYLLADIDWVVRTLCWSLAGGKKTGQGQPERIAPKQEGACMQKPRRWITDADVYQSRLGAARKAKHGLPV